MNNRNKYIDFIVTHAMDEIESIQDALKIARMTEEELKKETQSIREYYKRVHETTI